MGNYTVNIHTEGLDKATAEMLFGTFLEIANQWGITEITGGVYETPSDEEQIEIIKKQAENSGEDTE